MHTYPGLFENVAFRPRIHSNGHTYPQGSGAFWKRSAPNTELFENAPESGSFENGGLVSGSFLCVNMVSGSFLPLFPRRSTMACPSNEYCCTCLCSLVAETDSSSFLFVSKGVALENKMEDGVCCLQKQLYLVVFPDEGPICCFYFIFLRLWSLSFFTCLHDSQTTYSPSSGHKHVKQCRWTTLASIGNKQTNKKCDLSSRQVRLCQDRTQWAAAVVFRWRHISKDNPHLCGRGLRIDERHVWTPQNGSSRKQIFWKRIRVHVPKNTCAGPCDRRRQWSKKLGFWSYQNVQNYHWTKKKKLLTTVLVSPATLTIMAAAAPSGRAL